MHTTSAIGPGGGGGGGTGCGAGAGTVVRGGPFPKDRLDGSKLEDKSACDSELEPEVPSPMGLQPCRAKKAITVKRIEKCSFIPNPQLMFNA